MEKVESVIVGGYAVAFYGHVRTMQGLDLFSRNTERSVRKILAESVQVAGDSMKLTGASRIVVTDAGQVPLVQVLGDELYLSTAVRLKTGTATGSAGDIVLCLPQMHALLVFRRFYQLQ